MFGLGYPVSVHGRPGFFLTPVSEAAKDGLMKKCILAVCLGLAGFWGVQAEDSPVANPEKTDEKSGVTLRIYCRQVSPGEEDRIIDNANKKNKLDGSDPNKLRQAVAAAVRVLSADSDEDATILDGAAPELEQLIMAAGTISFFGTRRVVVLPEIDPAAYGSKDLDELCSTLSSLENAVAVLGSVFPLERSKLKLGKQAQKLQAQCKAIGYTEELAKPRPFELKNLMMERAKAQGATLPDGAATALLERCGEDPFLLENEVDKLCALSGYQTVSASMVAEMGTVSLEADVFEMIRMITAKNATGACKKLQTLLRLQQEPIAITAAMIGSYVDLYRVKLGAAKRKNYSAVHKDFGYKGSDYRLKRSAETATHYTLPQLEACLQVLLELDQSLKSQPVAAQTLLETALCRLALAGSGR